MEQISIASIIVEHRFRHDMGDIKGLAESIAELGQLQPIIINKDRRLIAGCRRLEAMKMLGHQAIAASVFDLDDLDALKVERDENDQRKEPTISEKVALAEAIAETIVRRQGKRTDLRTSVENSTEVEPERADEVAARKAGLGSKDTYRAAQKVIGRDIPELVEAMDRFKVTIHAAKNISELPEEEVRSLDFDDRQAVKNASSKADARARRLRAKLAESKVQPSPPAVAPKADESRLYQGESSVSAFVLAARAIHAISQISKNDPNAVAAIEDIRAALENQTTYITA